MLRTLLPLLLCARGVAGVVGGVVVGGPASWPAVWSAPPRSTPSAAWPDGPVVGDGNQGLAVGGGDGALDLYGTGHGFWSAAVGANSSMPPLRGGGSAAPSKEAVASSLRTRRDEMQRLVVSRLSALPSATRTVIHLQKVKAGGGAAGSK